jgi:hypothetical protein
MDNNRAIGIFDGGDKNLLAIVGIIFIHPIVFFLFTPFIKPFKISRIKRVSSGDGDVFGTTDRLIPDPLTTCPEIWNLKPETWNLEFEGWNL